MHQDTEPEWIAAATLAGNLMHIRQIGEPPQAAVAGVARTQKQGLPMALVSKAAAGAAAHAPAFLAPPTKASEAHGQLTDAAAAAAAAAVGPIEFAATAARRLPGVRVVCCLPEAAPAAAVAAAVAAGAAGAAGQCRRCLDLPPAGPLASAVAATLSPHTHHLRLRG